MEVEELLRLLLQEGMGQILIGSAILVTLTVFREFFTNHLSAFLEWCLKWCLGKLHNRSDPRVEIRFGGASEDKFDKYGPKNEESYKAIQTYLTRRSAHALGLQANSVGDISSPVLWVDNGREVSDEFNGVKVSWRHGGEAKRGLYSFRDRYLVLTFRQKDREMVEEYLRRVLEEGQVMMEAMMEEERAMRASRRQLKLYANVSSNRTEKEPWKCAMEFDHPAEFETFAMEDKKKEDIINDLNRFKAGREYYRRIGKPWKRGYLLYGPPGTGKSTLIAAMANFLRYDVYDLELTTVSDNASLKSLMRAIPGKSIIVIEDIDCSSVITGDRKKTVTDPFKEKQKEKEEKTLSGLLNCVDGLFTADDGGRVIVFTSNHIEEIDPALLRTGRMDKHIELTYCGLEAFKILAKVYLRIEEHNLFGRIEELLKECSISPADVAETLMGRWEGAEVEYCLEKLVRVLEEKVRNEEKFRKKGTKGR